VDPILGTEGIFEFTNVDSFSQYLELSELIGVRQMFTGRKWSLPVIDRMRFFGKTRIETNWCTHLIFVAISRIPISGPD